MAKLVAQWERRLAAEGLAVLDQKIRGRIVVRTEIITPKMSYIPQPALLADAIEAWLRGDGSHFSRKGLDLLSAPIGFGSRDTKWPKRRARILARICRMIARGATINGAARAPSETCIAYEFLRPLYASLAEHSAQDDDDDARDRADDHDSTRRE